jgi:hypothetical protein
MDEGWVSPTGNGFIGYVSQRQKGMFKTVTKVNRACACPNCGFVEIYLDPQELKQKLS